MINVKQFCIHIRTYVCATNNLYSYYRYCSCSVCVCVSAYVYISIRSFLQPRASTSRNIRRYVRIQREQKNFNTYIIMTFAKNASFRSEVMASFACLEWH